jgi:hypothetical protein
VVDPIADLRRYTMTTATCPSCDEPVKLSGHTRIGQEAICSRCREQLVVIRLKPLELGWADDLGWEVDDLDRRKKLNKPGKQKKKSHYSRDKRSSYFIEDEAY